MTEQMHFAHAFASLASSSHQLKKKKKKKSSNLSPQHLVTSFDDAPAVGTLHDNLEHAIAQYGQAS